MLTSRFPYWKIMRQIYSVLGFWFMVCWAFYLYLAYLLKIGLSCINCKGLFLFCKLYESRMCKKKREICQRSCEQMYSQHNKYIKSYMYLIVSYIQYKYIHVHVGDSNWSAYQSEMFFFGHFTKLNNMYFTWLLISCPLVRFIIWHLSHSVFCFSLHAALWLWW